MRQAEVWIGGYYRTKVGDRITRVKVERNVGKRGRSRDQFECVTADTGKVIYRTAAKLRPMVDAPRPAPVKRERVSFTLPEGYVDVKLVNPMPLRGVVTAIGNGPIDLVSADMVRGVVDRLHVAEPLRTVAAAIRRKLSRQYIYLSIPRSIRRGYLYAAAKRHAVNRNTYRMVMGEHPFPSEEMIGRAILGSSADRERLLRHVDELRAG